MRLSCTLFEIRRVICRNSPTSTNPSCIWHHRSNFTKIFGTRKLESVWPCGPVCFILHLAILVELRLASVSQTQTHGHTHTHTHTHTHRQTHGHSINRASIALRGKNESGQSTYRLDNWRRSSMSSPVGETSQLSYLLRHIQDLIIIPLCKTRVSKQCTV